MPKKTVKQRKIPERMCLGCREMKAKRDLIRIVRTPEGEIVIDPTGKKSGRGAYLCRNSECFNKGIKEKQLENALKVEIAPETIARLREELSKA